MSNPVRLFRPPADLPAPAELTEREIELLRRGGFVLDPQDLGEDDPRIRATREYEALLQSSLTVEEAAVRLEIAPSEILKRVTARPARLYGIRRGMWWVLPAFQFQERGLVPGFEEVVSNLDSQLHPLSVSSWFHLRNPDLPEDDREERNLSPREWLQSGHPPSAVAALAADL